MMDESNLAAGDARETIMLKTEVNGLPVEMPQPPQMSRSTLERNLRMKYGRRLMILVKRYFRSMCDVADYACYAACLVRYRDMRIVPRCYRVQCPDIRYTRHVARILDEFSYQLMLADMHYHKLRRLQLSIFLGHVHEKLKMIFPVDLNATVDLAPTKQDIIAVVKEEYRYMSDELLEEYGIDQQDK